MFGIWFLFGIDKGLSGMRLALILIFLSFSLSPLNAQEELPVSPLDVNPLLIGSPVPALIITDANNEPFDLAVAVKAKPTILVYYRGGW